MSPAVKAEVTNGSRHGVWLRLDGPDLFVRFAGFPWFREASIGQILDVTRPSAGHLYRPQLDVDLAVESVEHPERYPLVSRAPRRMPARPTEAVTVRESKPAYRSPRRCRSR